MLKSSQSASSIESHKDKVYVGGLPSSTSPSSPSSSSFTAVRNVNKKNHHVHGTNTSRAIGLSMQNVMTNLEDQRMELMEKKQTLKQQLKIVLKFPNVQKAMNMISSSREYQRKLWGFDKLKSTYGKVLTIREVKRMRSEERSMCNLEMSLRKQEEEMRIREETALALATEQEERRLEKVALKKAQTDEIERIREEQALILTRQKLDEAEGATRFLQRVIRGYVGRGLVKDIYRKRLLLELKLWGNGQTSSLATRRIVKENQYGLHIELAIQTSRCPSRPFKSLHSVQIVKEHLRRLKTIQEKETGQAAEMKRDYVRRMVERAGMVDEDKRSSLVQSIENRFIREQNATRAEIEEKLRQEKIEAARRERAKHLASTANAKDLERSIERLEGEEMRREDVLSQDLREIERALSKKIMDREIELMRREDLLANEHRRSMIQREKQTKIHAINMSKIKQMKEDMDVKVNKELYGDADSLSKSMTTTTGGDVFRVYNRGSMPTGDNNASASHKMMTKAEGLIYRSYFYTADIDKRGRCKLQLEELNLLRDYLTLSLPLSSLRSISIKKNPSSSDPPLYENIWKKANKKMCIVDAALKLNEQTVNNYLSIVELRNIRNERKIQYVMLQTALGRFRQAHAYLHECREVVSKTKTFTRKERLQAIEDTKQAETHLVQIKKSMNSSTLLLYRLAIEEINRFVQIFQTKSFLHPKGVGGGGGGDEKSSKKNTSTTCTTTSTTTDSSSSSPRFGPVKSKGSSDAGTAKTRTPKSRFSPKLGSTSKGIVDQRSKNPSSGEETTTTPFFDEMSAGGSDEDSVGSVSSIGSASSTNSRSFIKKGAIRGSSTRSSKTGGKQRAVVASASSSSSSNVSSAPLALTINTNEEELAKLDEELSVRSTESDGASSVRSNSTLLHPPPSSSTAVSGAVGGILKIRTPVMTPGGAEAPAPLSSSSPTSTSPASPTSTTSNTSSSRNKSSSFKLSMQKKEAFKKNQKEMFRSYEEDMALQEGEKKAAERRFRFAYLKPKHNMPRPSLPCLPFNFTLTDDVDTTAKHPMEGWKRFVQKSARDEYRCIKAARDAIEWYQVEFRVWEQGSEKKWKKENTSECVSCLQRMNYLVSPGTKSKSKNKGSSNSDGVFTIDDHSTEILQYVQSADILDLMDLLLSRLDMEVSVYDPVKQRKHSITLTADAMDQHLCKHPASVSARPLFLLAQFNSKEGNTVYKKKMNANLEFSFSPWPQKVLLPFDRGVVDDSKQTSEDPEQRRFNQRQDICHEVKCSRVDFKEAHLTGNLSKRIMLEFDWGFKSIADTLSHDRQDLLTKWKSNGNRRHDNIGCSVLSNLFESYEALTAATKTEQNELKELLLAILSESSEGRQDELMYLKQNNKEDEQQELELFFDSKNTSNLMTRSIRAVSTLNEILINYPGWMHPLYHFGQMAPKFTLAQLIAMEKERDALVGLEDIDSTSTSSKTLNAIAIAPPPMGKFAKMQKIEEAVDTYAKHLVSTLRARFYTRKKQGERTVLEVEKLEKQVQTLMAHVQEVDLKISKLIFGMGLKALSEKRAQLIVKIDSLNGQISNIKPPELSPKDLEDIKQTVLQENSKRPSAKMKGWTTSLFLEEEEQEGGGAIAGFKDPNNREMWIFGGLKNPIVVYRLISDSEQKFRGSVYLSLHSLLEKNLYVNVKNSVNARIKINTASLRSGFNDSGIIKEPRGKYLSTKYEELWNYYLLGNRDDSGAVVGSEKEQIEGEVSEKQVRAVGAGETFELLYENDIANI